jgi:2-dehydro-3-deoxyphosphogluconate aldolase/(4S)-4-hydroxy-2-oxoglutarate aldolase
MSREHYAEQLIEQQGLLPLYYSADEAVSSGVLRALYESGVRAVEYTNRGPAALHNFKAMRKLCDAEMKDLYLGIGTIKSADMASAFVDAGADFLVSPVFDTSVCDVAYLNKILWVPGCMTPTEIHEAEKAGCTLVKLFPGNVLGPGYMGAIKELFPHTRFMPTGGVELEESNLKAWFAAGVVAVGMGSKLITSDILQDKKYDLLKANTAEALRIIKNIRGK